MRSIILRESYFMNYSVWRQSEPKLQNAYFLNFVLANCLRIVVSSCKNILFLVIVQPLYILVLNLRLTLAFLDHVGHGPISKEDVCLASFNLLWSIDSIFRDLTQQVPFVARVFCLFHSIFFSIPFGCSQHASLHSPCVV